MAPVFASLLVSVAVGYNAGEHVAEPAAVTQRVKDLQESSDYVAKWVRARLQPDADDAVYHSLTTLWKDFSDYAKMTLKLSDRERGHQERFRAALTAQIGNSVFKEGVEKWKAALRSNYEH